MGPKGGIGTFNLHNFNNQKFPSLAQFDPMNICGLQVEATSYDTNTLEYDFTANWNSEVLKINSVDLLF